MEAATANGAKPHLFDEKGSAADGQRLFATWDGFQSLELPGQPDVADLENMLDRDGKARSLEQVLTLPLRWAGWSIEPQQDDTGEAEFVREALSRPANAGGMVTSMDLVIAQMANAAVFRRAFFEKVFQPFEQGLGYRKLALRPARTCTILRDKRDQAFAGFRQKFTRDGQPVEETFKPDKAFVYLHAQHKDPVAGHTDLATCWRTFEAKQKVRFLWFQFLENQTIPKAIAQSDSTDEEQARKFAEKIATLKGGGVVGTVRGQSVEAFESSGRGAAEFRSAMDWLSAEQSQSVLASFTDLASQGSGRGSFALSRDQSDLFLRSRQAVLGEMAADLSSFVVADLVRWTFGPDAKVPLFRFGDLAEHHSDAVRELFLSLAGQERLNPSIPSEFLDLLTEKVAHHLELDVDVVRKALQDRGAETDGDRLRVGIDRAARLVEESGVAR